MPNQPPFHWMLESFSLVIKRPERGANHLLHLVTRLQMPAVVHPVPHAPSWLVTGQVYYEGKVEILNGNYIFSSSDIRALLYYTGRFIMFSVITNIYNKKTKGHLNGIFHSHSKTEKVFFFFFDN